MTVPKSTKAKRKAEENIQEKEGKKTKDPQAEESKEPRLQYDVLTELVRLKCDAFMNPEDLYTTKFMDNIKDVWGSLISRNITSAPILTEDGYLEGFVDLVDIARYLVDKFGRSMYENKQIDEMTTDMQNALEGWMQKTVRDVKEHGHHSHFPVSASPFHAGTMVGYAGYSLMSALEPMAQEQGVHRVAIVESRESNKFANMITQSQALKYLASHLSHLGSKKSKHIEQCKDVIKSEGVFSVTGETLALKGFEYMLTNRVSAVAVLNAPGGSLIGVLKIRDLQVLGQDCRQMKHLYTNAHSYLKQVEQSEEGKMTDEPAEAGGKDLPVPDRWMCHVGDTLGKVMKQMHKYQAQQLFLVNKEQEPIGVVSAKEVLLELLS